MNSNFNAITENYTEADNNLFRKMLANPAITVPNGANLNDYTTVGIYSCHANTSAETMTNLPNKEAFTLIVMSQYGGNIDWIYQSWIYIIQILLCGAGEFYMRTGTTHSNTNGDVSWGAWYKFSGTAV